MDIKTKNAEIIYEVEKELLKHIGDVTNHFTSTRSHSGVLTVLGKTITPLNDLANPYTLTVTFLNDQVNQVILSRGERCVSMSKVHIKSSVEAFALRIQEIRDGQ